MKVIVGPGFNDPTVFEPVEEDTCGFNLVSGGFQAHERTPMCSCHAPARGYPITLRHLIFDESIIIGESCAKHLHSRNKALTRVLRASLVRIMLYQSL